MHSLRRGVFIFALSLGMFVATDSIALAADAYLSQLESRALSQKSAEKREWLTLLHYRQMPSASWRSEADGPGFFNAGRAGKTDPTHELIATLRQLRTTNAPSKDGQHPQCRFPARWTWLKSELKIDPDEFPDQPCPLFDVWKQAISPENVTLVYAAAYLNSPASMYGHTFLRLQRSTGAGNVLIDYIINFAADIDTDNGFLYAIKGILGGFKGHFYTMPFYVKIQEYSNIESRDLWEYRLSFTAEESRRLIAHVWETRSTHFDYFFQSENCSYFLLGVLDVARPSLRLSEQFRGAVIPVDTVRAILAVPGLVQGRKARPSLLSVLRNRRDRLTPDERRTADALAVNGKRSEHALDRYGLEQKAKILDTAHDLMRFRTKPNDRVLEAYETKERELLVMRGRTGISLPEPANTEVIGAPESGHRSSRIGISMGVSRYAGFTDTRAEHRSFTQLSLRGSIHDYLDRADGFPDGALLEMGHLRLRFEHETRRFLVDGLDLIHIISATPVETWIAKPSWRVWFGANRVPNLGKTGTDSLFGGLVTGGGMSVRPGRKLFASAMLESHFGAGPVFNDLYRIGGGARVQAVLSITRWWRMEANAVFVRFVAGEQRSSPSFFAGQAIDLAPNFQLRTTARVEGDAREIMGGFFGYF
jgi:Domain of unknown function (DUF4105)